MRYTLLLLLFCNAGLLGEEAANRVLVLRDGSGSWVTVTVNAAGEKDGPTITYRNDILVDIQYWKDGKKDGVYVEFAPDNTVRCSGGHVGDLPMGVWRWYDAQGGLIESLDYGKKDAPAPPSSTSPPPPPEKPGHE